MIDLSNIVVPSPPAPIGGIGVSGEGGCLYVAQAYGYYGVQPSLRIDVASWRLATSYSEQSLAIGGMMGATSSRRTGYAYVWEAEVVVDIRQAADMPFWSLQVEALFHLGYQAYWPTVADRYVWIPRAHIQETTAVTDAAGKKRGRMHLAGVANCHVFPLPDAGSPNNPSTAAGAYQLWLNSHA